jgi:heat-inducible transcriptional repressor
MDSRKKKLLTHIIDAHIKTAQAVGSNLIAQKYMKEVSGPTVRNVMQELEREGYITHLHTSAGRVPTEKGYREYLENIDAKEVSDKHVKAIDEARKASKDAQERVKTVAKKTAELSNSAVVVAFTPQDVYYTGLSNLFSHPEFGEQDMVVNMSQVIDHLDEVMGVISNKIDDEISILIGSDNPFGTECGSIMSITKGGMVFGILGPMRMDYEQNIGLIKYIKKLF